MTPHTLAGLTAILFATIAQAADPVVVQPKPVILPSDPLPAAIAPVAPPAQTKATQSVSGKQAKQPARALKKAKARPAKSRKARSKPV